MANQAIDASFLAVPNEWEKRQDRWKELTFEGELWRGMRQLVSQGATNETFETLHAHLEAWQKVISNLPNGMRQWEKASRLLEVAKLAAPLPQMQDERLERAAFPNLSSWEWDAFCAFRGNPRHVEHTVTLTALLIDRQTETGFTAQLTIERLQNGEGIIYPSPQEHAFLTLEKDFAEAIANAEDFVKKQGFSFDSIDIRWSLERHDKRSLLSRLSGPSIGGAFAMGLMKLLGGEAQ